MSFGSYRGATASAATLIAMLCLSAGSASGRTAKETGAERLGRLRARARATFLLHEPESAGKGPGKGGPGQGRGFSPELQVTAGIPGTQSETSIAVTGNNVVVGFNQFDPNHPTQRTGVAFSTNGGLSFTDIGGLPTGGSGKTLLGDPSVSACGDGKFYFSSIYFPNATDSAVAVSVGTVSGANIAWANPLTAATSTTDFLDKPWLTCDRLTNTLYLAYTRFVNGNAGPTTELRVELIKSTDGGAGWSAPLVLESSTTEEIGIPYLATGPNSEVYAMWERGLDDITASSTALELRRSFNFAVSFDPKVVVRTMTPSFFPAPVGFNREDTIELGTLAVDLSSGPRRGRLYAIWVERPAAGGETRDVFVAASGDQGATWSAPVRVNDDPPGHDQVMPWLSVNAQGTAEAIWYDFRNWPGMHTVDVYAARSTDGGTSFSPNFRITTRPSSWFAPLTLTPNFGDYISCTSEGTGFYPSWADARNNDIDVFAAHVPTDTCGNGTMESFEQCDDGNAIDGDSCSPACATTLCGNGVLDAGEGCDDGNLKSGDGCSQVCAPEVCGDGIIQPSNHENCDDGNLVSGDGCSSSCLVELSNAFWVVEERSRLVLQSLVTGIFFTLGDPGFHELGDLAFDSAGNLYGSTGYNPNLSIGYDGFLLKMAQGGLPGRATIVGDTGWLSTTAIDFHPTTGVLYAIVVDGSGASRLVTLDPVTGATLSVVGVLGLTDARAMAFDAAGALYVSGRPGSTGGGNLYLVNLAPFSLSLVGSVGSFLLSGMDFAPDGTLYGVALRGTGADRALVRVNKSTGAGTILFISGALNQQGIRFAPQRAVDADLDGIQDVADCSPHDAANAPPGLATAVAFSNATTLTWIPAPGARLSNTYRGTIAGPMATRLPASVYDQLCLESGDQREDGATSTVDATVPPVGQAFYYLVSGEGCGEGALDTDATHPIPNPNPCPTPP